MSHLRRTCPIPARTNTPGFHFFRENLYKQSECNPVTACATPCSESRQPRSETIHPVLNGRKPGKNRRGAVSATLLAETSRTAVESVRRGWNDQRSAEHDRPKPPRPPTGRKRLRPKKIHRAAFSRLTAEPTGRTLDAGRFSPPTTPPKPPAEATQAIYSGAAPKRHGINVLHRYTGAR